MKKMCLLLVVAIVLAGLSGCSPAARPNAGESADPGSSAPAFDSSAEGHVHVEEVIPAVEPTCTEAGLSEGKRCSVCGEILVKQETIPALGHTTTSGTCTRCGQSFGNWALSYYVDEFKQPTEEWYIGNTTRFTGVFSNSATEDSLLTADVLVDYEKDVCFFLYEYGSSLVKNYSDRFSEENTILMRTADGTDHHLTGTLYGGGDRIFIDDPYMEEVLTALRGEGSIRFYLQNDDRTLETYLFTVEPSNFGDLYARSGGSV